MRLCRIYIHILPILKYEVKQMEEQYSEKQQRKNSNEDFNSVTQKMKPENQNQTHNVRREGMKPSNQK